MNVTVNRYTPPGLVEGTHYLISIVKDVGVECKFVVEIVRLPEEMHPFFYDQYNADKIENDFYVVNFFDYVIFKQDEGVYRYTPVVNMKFTFKEMREFVNDGLAVAVFDYIENNNFGAIVAIPMDRGLSWMYNKVLRENEQNLGYNYNQSYMEQHIHVIEP
ncbi:MULTISPECIES: hypothetical protein [Rahnella]|jgi:hypothetical protein|uniref:hypothetical protein n=1 Tax=Rahnella TaxID=34037 RepID=UPI000DD39978|nr:hypothetical protein [Rahnella sp. NRRL B-41462]CAH0133550.1 hypothetical protein SRABI106_00048 [Rahnella aquatilis]